jgi:uncharacterized OB-fold protein
VPAHDYLGWHAWAEEQAKKGIVQTLCKTCGLWFFPEEMGTPSSDNEDNEEKS